MRVRRAGPAAWYVDVAESPSPEVAARLGALQRALLEGAPAPVRDVVPGYTNLLIEVRPGASMGRLRRWLEATAQSVEEGGPGPTPARHLVSVRYGEGADRAELEARLNLPWERIATLHAGARYTVAFLGFTPGFPYLLGLPRELVTPRRESPRPRVPGGSVAIAGEQAGIYPSASPGGWWIVGHTGERLFDREAWPPTRWAAGDEVRFLPSGPDPEGAPARSAEPGASDARVPAAPLGDAGAAPALEVLEAWPPSATLQAGPRWRVGHLGLAQAGALDATAHLLANRAVGNAADAAALELLALPLTLRALAPVTAAVACGGHRVLLDGRPAPCQRPFAWRPGAVLELLPGGRAGGNASYLALAGGVAAHAYGGSSSTDVRAGVGGSRRALRGGDVLALGAGRIASTVGAGAALRPRYPARIGLRIHPGPQYDPDTFRRLLASTFKVAGLDRTGVRLDGPPLPQPAPDIRSEGVPWGALQLPADGHPIVLLADRGRTGGYAKPAVVDVRDLWQLAQAPVGTEVWLIAAEGRR